MTTPKTQDISYTQAVARILQQSSEPLTVDELLPLVHQLRPVTSRNPKSTIRNAIQSNNRVTTLGGRPARYTWWPNHLQGNVLRQPLTPASLRTGHLCLTDEVFTVMWPDFMDSVRGDEQPHIQVRLGDETLFSAPISHLVKGRSDWGFKENTVLSEWLQAQGATQQDALLVAVEDVEDRLYSFQLERFVDRDEDAIASRNEALLEKAEEVLRQASNGALRSTFISRLVVRNVFQHGIPPDPMDALLRLDMRFLSNMDFNLTEKHVTYMERHPMVGHGFGESPRPRGDRRKAKTDKARQKWAKYLFDRGMEYLWAGLTYDGEAYHREAVRMDPSHADGWVHVGNRLYEKEHIPDALYCYQKAQEAAEDRTIGVPEEYEPPFWLDVDTRPFMRALHGQGLCLWQLQKTKEAKVIFDRMMRLNPNDNQGVRFLLHDLEEGMTLEESVAREEGVLTFGDV